MESVSQRTRSSHRTSLSGRHRHIRVGRSGSITDVNTLPVIAVASDVAVTVVVRHQG